MLQGGCPHGFRHAFFDAAVLNAIGNDIGHIVWQGKLSLHLAEDQPDNGKHTEPVWLQIAECF